MAVLCTSFSSSSVLRAAPPFDSKDANVVLRSSDNVDFKVHKHIIKLASPVLAAFISLAPNPPPPPSASRRHHKRRIVELSEPSEFLDMFLRFVYPVPEPLLALDDVATVLELSHKYDSSTVTSRMRTHLLRPEFLESDPLQVYTLASFAAMDDVARIAARHTLRHPPPRPAHLTEKRMLPGAALVRLLNYRQRCVAAARRVARIENATVPWWIQLQWQRFCFLSECGWECAKLPRRTLKWHKRLHECVEVPVYWIEYMNAVGTALGDSLDPAVARDRDLLRQAVEKAAGCSKCAGRVVWDLQEFSEILQDAIGEAIAGIDLSMGTNRNEYEDDDYSSRALVPSTKTNYLLPCDRPAWPMFDYSFTLYCKRLDQCVDEGDECGEEDEYNQHELMSSPPSSEY